MSVGLWDIYKGNTTDPSIHFREDGVTLEDEHVFSQFAGGYGTKRFHLDFAFMEIEVETVGDVDSESEDDDLPKSESVSYSLMDPSGLTGEDLFWRARKYVCIIQPTNVGLGEPIPGEAEAWNAKQLEFENTNK